MSRITLRRPSLALAGILIAIGGCAESPSSPVTREFVHRSSAVRYDVSGSGSASAVIDARGGTLKTATGDRITFPAGALTQPTLISITSDGQYAGVELEPHGLRFTAGREPVLRLNVANSDANAYRNVDVVYVDESGAIAEIMPTERKGDTMETHLRHFSGYLASGH